MEACAEQDIPLIVMDRPNPNAFYVDGPVLQKEFKSFVGMHPVPVVYGMTIGEYAGMINGEGWLKDNVICNLDRNFLRGMEAGTACDVALCPVSEFTGFSFYHTLPVNLFFEGTVINEGRGHCIRFKCSGIRV